MDSILMIDQISKFQLVFQKRRHAMGKDDPF